MPSSQMHSPESTFTIPSEQSAAYTETRRQYWEEYAATASKWASHRRYYQRRLAEIYKLSVPPGMRILELGCGEGDLLAKLEPAYGYGIDLSPRLIGTAKSRYPGLHFETADAGNLQLEGEFDFIICSDLLNDLWDVQTVFEQIAGHCHPGTRILINCYSRLWEGPRHLAEALGLAKPQLSQNWLTVEDIQNLLTLAGFELVRTSAEILCPVRVPLVDTLCNRYLVKVWPFRWLGLTNFIVARPVPALAVSPEPIVTVVVPARNEAGNIAAILDRVPTMGAGTELIFVEGNSSDGTYERIEQEIAGRAGCTAKLYKQTGRGKGDAVRLGFERSSGELLMILDADLTVPPEDLPRFYEAWRLGRGDFINGVRLVYPMEQKAMRFFNLLGNKFFSLAFTWLLSQSVKDSLCGTKVLSRVHYQAIAANRAYFGEIDPFGDFDLLFGAARYNLKILGLPIRYRERKYGETNIQRWKHGVVLLRMVLLASRRIRFV
jgi:2-polyprenyl-3-methyl-5-hydroxy-6-metoxy-1,4-benzoquinol methylase